jgi:hypothetical protein
MVLRTHPANLSVLLPVALPMPGNCPSPMSHRPVFMHPRRVSEWLLRVAQQTPGGVSRPTPETAICEEAFGRFGQKKSPLLMGGATAPRSGRCYVSYCHLPAVLLFLLSSFLVPRMLETIFSPEPVCLRPLAPGFGSPFLHVMSWGGEFFFTVKDRLPVV